MVMNSNIAHTARKGDTLEKGFLNNLLQQKKVRLTEDELADFLQTSPQALEMFEKEYAKASIAYDDASDNLFDKNSRMAATEKNAIDGAVVPDTSEIEDRIVEELIHPEKLEDGSIRPVTLKDLQSIPKQYRPQLTGTMMKRDIAGDDRTCDVLLYNLKMSMQADNPKVKATWYHMFRQGLDILDLDPITYEIIGMNRNSIGHWFPEIREAAMEEGFFHIPEIKYVKVPLPILQLTRLDYGSLTPATLNIVNKWAVQAFGLDPQKDYFIKTGTYSSKFDFRNAKVTDPAEVKEIGEYLLFIHFQALMMASPLSSPSIYGVSTTNEWAVREYIHDKEDNPCIYHGMPLHTEYRVFVDFDTAQVLGITPYWDPGTMKKRFSQGNDADTPDMKHDYIVYKMHEKKLMERYQESKDIVLEHMRALVPLPELHGQWSVDVMQNGEDFYIIDMALAEMSAFYDKCVPAALRRPSKENWIPKIS